MCVSVALSSLFDISRGGIASNPWENNFWLDLDFLEVATAAQRCSAHFTSLLYIEIWRGTSEGERSIFNGRQEPEEAMDQANEEVSMCVSDQFAEAPYCIFP